MLANDVSTVVAEAFALGTVEGECQKWLLLLFWWCLGVLGVWCVGSIIEDELGWLLPKMADG